MHRLAWLIVEEMRKAVSDAEPALKMHSIGHPSAFSARHTDVGPHPGNGYTVSEQTETTGTRNTCTMSHNNMSRMVCV
jgi:hypothetical protein